MKIARFLEMPFDKEQAELLQKKYAKEIVVKQLKTKNLIAAADVSYGSLGDKAYASVVVIEKSSLEMVEQVTWVGTPEYSYQPGLLALREVPCLLKAFEKLQTIPDVVIIDGNGVLHPRRFGLACHMGLCLDIPTIGCAKSLHFGNHKQLFKQGESSYVKDKGEKLGIAIKTMMGESPIYISIGHKVDLQTAKKLVLNVTKKREPIPISLAHNLCRELYQKDRKANLEIKQQDKLKIVAMAKRLKEQGLSYQEIANKLNKDKELKQFMPRKCTPKKIRNWLKELIKES